MAPGRSRNRPGPLRPGPVLLSLALLAAACSSPGNGGAPGSGTTTRTGDTTAIGPVRIENQGGSMEGHTPRGFAGMGRGLFTGDDLNSRFPEGEGVQFFLTFSLPSGTAPPRRAVLSSDALRVSGTPFDDLGGIIADSIQYGTFGPQLFDLPTDGDPVTCRRLGDNGLRCDVTDLVRADIEAGASLTQFRLRFEVAADNDGRQDLAMFFLRDSNTNEPGIFSLELVP